jgi:hypothetical protein
MVIIVYEIVFPCGGGFCYSNKKITKLLARPFLDFCFCFSRTIPLDSPWAKNHPFYWRRRRRFNILVPSYRNSSPTQSNCTALTPLA